ncbi:MAG: AAA family ATPase [bacterium]
MLRAIHLKRFGMFSERTFALGPVTVFSGANQSGKSTVFDAIRIHAFQPGKRGKENRDLYGRYGEAWEAELDWNNGAPEMSDATFMNLFAISGGDVSIDLGGDWLSAVKKSLFAGGIDPRNLIALFEKTSSQKGTLAHMKERSRLEKDRGAAEERLEEQTAERERILVGLQGQAAREADIKGVSARLGVAKGGETELAAEVAFEEQVAERAGLEETLGLLGRVGEMERTQQDWRHLSVDRTAELDELEQALRVRETQHIRIGETLRAAAERLETTKTEAERAGRELEVRQGWAEAVTLMENRRARFEELRFTKGMVRAIVAICLAAVGAGVLVLSGMAGWGVAVLGVAGVLAGAIALLPGWYDQWRLKRDLRELWRGRAGGAIGLEEAQGVLNAGTIAGMVDALARVRAVLERLRAEREAKLVAVTEGEGALVEAEREDNVIRLAFESAQKEIREWLESLQVKNRDEYRDQLTAYQRDLKILAEGYGRLENEREKGGFADNHALKADIERRLRDLDAEGVPRQDISAGHLRAQREKLKGLREEVSRLEREHHALDREKHGVSERLAGELGRLPEEIAAQGEALRGLASRIEALDADRLAAGLALELFREVAEDETAVLAELSAGVSSVFARLSGLDETREAAVTLTGLDHGEIRALDRHGHFRSAGHLSSGARHLLYLALRLEMARRERNGRFALLCLDEPFAFLDPERQMETLQYLREFLEEMDWQLILFTNDPAHAGRVRAVFPDCRAYDLDETGSE